MKLYFALQADAQAKADAVHQWLISSDPAYAGSVKNGQTKQWTIPAQDVDAKGIPLTPDWFIFVEDKCMAALTPTEQKALKA